MKASNYIITTLKETPNDAEIPSHQLMLRAGLIRKVAAGIYTWLPMGLRVLAKIKNIIREEMNNIGVNELLLPGIQPAELWEETGRFEKYGPMLLKMQDRKKRNFCYGPTHEEVITDWFRQDIHSYKSLPVLAYQIQTKFRDEIRPRFGVMRAREFIMKDAYSFHIDIDCLQYTYNKMYQAYSNIFTRMDLKFCAVLADSGEIGGSVSHEFHILADNGEDKLAVSTTGNYGANVEQAQTLPSETPRTVASKKLHKVATPGIKTVQTQAEHMQCDTKHILKTLIVKGIEVPAVALLIRGDHTLNVLKAEKLPAVKAPLEMVSEQELFKIANCAPGFVGPIGLDIPMYADFAAHEMANFSCGANETDWHHDGVNWGRDLKEPQACDLREIQAGDPSPDKNGTIIIKHGIEAGHIFQLGDKYAKAMNATVLDENGKAKTVKMGCYGIGVTRIVAAAIEQNHDESGIIWPVPIAPFHVVLIPINYQKDNAVKTAADKLYQEFKTANIEVLLDDRSLSPGIKFKDMDLIGIPIQIVIGKKHLQSNNVEYVARKNKNKEIISLSNILNYVLDLK